MDGFVAFAAISFLLLPLFLTEVIEIFGQIIMFLVLKMK